VNHPDDYNVEESHEEDKERNQENALDETKKKLLLFGVDAKFVLDYLDRSYKGTF
jgi:hypothetical protein